MIGGLLQKLTGRNEPLTNTGQDQYHQGTESKNSMTKSFDDFLKFVKPAPHAKYGPSGADRWMACPATIQFSEGIVEERSKYAEEGTLAHSYCEALIRHEFFGFPVPMHLNLQLAQTEDQGEEMHRCALEYLDVISYWLNNPALGKIVWWGLEKGVPVVPDRGCFGTGDCIVVGEKGAAVIDFKYGRGKNVAANTVQLKVYAAGLAQYLPVAPGSHYPVTAVIHQPRINDAAKEHEYALQELIDFIPVINQAIDKAEGVNPEAVDGSHCHWCPARRTNDPTRKCTRIKQKAIDLASNNFDKFLADSSVSLPAIPGQADTQLQKRDQAIVKLMALLPHIKDVVDNAKEEFMDRLERGEAIEGIKVKRKEGNRKINAENTIEAEKLIRQYFPTCDPLKTVPATTKLRTIGDLEKELGKGKLDVVCIKKVTKEIEVIDSKTRQILDSMSQFAQTIGGLK